MSGEWRIEDSQCGYTLHDPSGRVVGVLHDAEAAITILRSLNHLEALEIVRALAERGPFTDGAGGCRFCRFDTHRYGYTRAPFIEPNNHESSCLWRRALAAATPPSSEEDE